MFTYIIYCYLHLFPTLVTNHLILQHVGIRVQDLKKGQITMDIDFRWGGDPSIILAVEAAIVASIPIQVSPAWDNLFTRVNSIIHHYVRSMLDFPHKNYLLNGCWTSTEMLLFSYGVHHFFCWKIEQGVVPSLVRIEHSNIYWVRFLQP